MTYVHIARQHGFGMSEYEQVRKELATDAPAGLLTHHVGVVDGSLVIVDVWLSRADADRFAAEQLFPAFERAGLRHDPHIDIAAFEPLHSTGVS
jgi:hypothetical protein